MFNSENQQIIKVESDGAISLINILKNAKFCKDECPIPRNRRNWGCDCRPIKYMKECPKLKAFKKKENWTMDEILRKSDILSTDEKISILRDAVDFLPATYINEKKQVWSNEFH